MSSNTLPMTYFEDFEIGDVQNYSKRYEVTEEEIIEIATRFDPQPFHIDKQAAETSIFGGLVACSMHIFGMAGHIGATDNTVPPVKAVSALGFKSMKMIGPVRPGDSVWVQRTVLNKRLSSSMPNTGILEVRCDMFNQKDEPVFTYETAFLIECRSNT